MAGGNLFKRKGLLPFKGQGDGGSDTPPPADAFGSSADDSGSYDEEVPDDVFMRPTIVPDFGAAPSGFESGPPERPAHSASDHNVTARPPEAYVRSKDSAPPNANTYATIPAAANPRQQPTGRDRARNTTPVEAPPDGVKSWAHRAIRPPAHSSDPSPRSANPGNPRSTRQEKSTRDRGTPLAPPSQPDPWGATSSPDSLPNALGFVDALPRLTTRPPDRDHMQPRRNEDGDRTSVISLSELFALSDFSGALQMAEFRLANNPADAEAQRYAQDCRRVLIKMQISRLGSLQQVAELAIDPDELQWLSLDHRAGFILSLVDGQLTIDDLLDICGMQRLDALQIVAELVEKKVLNLRSAR
jgi:hypothetical protein